MIRTLVPLALAAALATGCYSSAYQPRSSGRVAVMMKDSKTVYVRDGRTYEHGLFGRGLAKAVAGNPYAEAAARAYSDRQRDGFWMAIGGLACSLGAVTVAAVRVGNTPAEQDPPVPLIEIGVAVGCLVVSYAGIFRIAGAEAMRWDAINIFNDGPAPAPCPRLPGAPGATGCAPARRPEVSLTMER